MSNPSELIATFTNQEGLGELKSITPVIGQGEVNQVFVVETDQSRVVLRLNDISKYDRFIKGKRDRASNRESFC